MEDSVFNTVEEIIQDIRMGKMVIIVDDEDRENEGDLVAAAQFVTPEIINFMMKHGRGLICVPMDPKLTEKLNLYLMTDDSDEKFGTWFTISVDAKEGVTTGISAHDRSTTIRKLSSVSTKPEDFVRPGHVFPLKARKGGVLVRRGHTEAAVDLMTIAGIYPVGVICEIAKDDGTMARLPDLIEFAKKFSLKIGTIDDIVKYRYKNEKVIERVSEAFLPSKYGTFNIVVYKELFSDKEDVVILKGDVKNKENILVRIHSECFTGDILGSLRCDCGPQLSTALEMIEKEGEGALIYLRQEGRGIGLGNKVKAYKLQEEGVDTLEANLKLGLPADGRDYGVAAQIINDLGIKSIRLLTNNPRKIERLKIYGIQITQRVPLIVGINEYNKHYLETKAIKMGHLIDF
jgi:3,4-dihydroxy 2-butanone 4-phosphate synthase/GTP cyclohydrolase II